MSNISSRWPDQRDVPDSRFGKTPKPSDCTCTERFTCRVCLKNAEAWLLPTSTLAPADAGEQS